jgi:hypothetical protein
MTVMGIPYFSDVLRVKGARKVWQDSDQRLDEVQALRIQTKELFPGSIHAANRKSISSG